MIYLMRISNKKLLLLICLIIIIFAVLLNSYTFCSNSNPRIPKNVPREVKAVIKDLFSCDREAYRIAIKKLQSMRAEAAPAVPFFVEMLESKKAVYRVQYARVVNPMIHLFALAYGELFLFKSEAYVDRNRVRTYKSIAEAALKAIGDPQAVEPLLKIELNKTGNKKQIAKSLNRMKNPRTVELLLEKAKEGPTQEVISAIEILGEMRDKRAVEPLIKIVLEDKRTYARTRAATALRKIGDPRAAEQLLEKLNKYDADGIYCMGLFGDDRFLERLFEMLKKAIKNDDKKMVGATVGAIRLILYPYISNPSYSRRKADPQSQKITLIGSSGGKRTKINI